MQYGNNMSSKPHISLHYTAEDLELISEARKRFLSTIASCMEHVDMKKIERALDIAIGAHVGQYRASGEPYILHPIAVAEILTELKVDTKTLMTALLHDTIEDTAITKEDLSELLDEETADLVEGVTKLAKLGFQQEHVAQAENFRKLLLAISKDLRVLLVKLADRLHNMRTLQYMKNEAKRHHIALETMEIYAPLAERIGIHKFKNELQDLAFAELHPEIRRSIISRTEFLEKEGISLVDTIIKALNKNLSDGGLRCLVDGRQKTPCSIWYKMEGKNIAFEQLADIIAFRVLVDTDMDCYRALGIIHKYYHMIPGSFKDFISTPKPNGYRSLHTLVMGPEKRCIEIQIRTHEMHEVAELGVAAHWRYKQQHVDQSEAPLYRWIRELLDILKHTSNAEEFLENTKMEMYYDRVFCFTPKGELMALPSGATALDFAFALHTDIGLSAVGARVNGRVVPLKTTLQNGDQVEITRSKTPIPSSAWEQFVVTGKAKSEIKKFMKGKKRSEYITLGKSILSKSFDSGAKPLSNKNLEEVAKSMKYASVDDLIAGLGEGVVNRKDVMNALDPKYSLESSKRSLNPLSLLKFRSAKKNEDSARDLPISGLTSGVSIHFASCCCPIPGDRIVALMDPGKGAAIHRVDCSAIYTLDSDDKPMNVIWDQDISNEYIARISVALTNEPGSLAKLTAVIAADNINIKHIEVRSRSIDFFDLLVEVEVTGTTQLHSLVGQLRSLSCVHSVARAK